MSTYKNLISLGAAVVLALGLAACSSGSDTPLTPDPDPDPDPKPPASACPGTDAASHKECVDEKKMAMDEAKEALDAVKADQSSTQAQIKTAQDAYDAAVTAYNTAVTAQNTYAAMQAPTYGLKAMATAMDSVGTLPTGVTAADGTGDSSVRGGMVTVNNADGDNTWSKATWPIGKITGYPGNVWEKSDDSIVVYTNVQAKKGAKWSAFYIATAPTGIAEGFTWQPRNTVAISGVNDDGVVSMNTDLSAATPAGATSVEKLFSADGFPSGNGASINYPDNDKVTTNAFKVEFTGTFHGVAGKYECTRANNDGRCGASNNDKGVLQTLTGTWTFTPTSLDSEVADVRSDADFLDFGYWVNTDDSGDTDTYKVGTFFRGQQPRGDVSSVTGKATYKGGAAGLYTKRAFAPGGDGAVTAAGRFTADAELTAYFAQDTGQTIAPTNLNTISGEIKNFMDGGQVIDAAWSLKLPKAAISTDPAGTFSVTDSWSGEFYGPGGDTNPQPTGVAGKFTGGFNNGEVVGSFGATKTSN